MANHEIAFISCVHDARVRECASCICFDRPNVLVVKGETSICNESRSYRAILPSQLNSSDCVQNLIHYLPRPVPHTKDSINKIYDKRNKRDSKIITLQLNRSDLDCKVESSGVCVCCDSCKQINNLTIHKCVRSYK